jgi:hypothetical protein
VRPAIERRLSFRRAKQALDTSISTRMPAGSGRSSTPYSSSARASRPSVSPKPSAKSSRSSGVASITACEMPLKTSATGTSSASQSSDSVTAPSRRTRTSRRRAPVSSVAVSTVICRRP